MVAGFVMKLVPPKLVCGCAPISPISEGYRLLWRVCRTIAA